MRSYADDLANTEQVEKVVDEKAKFIIDQVQRDVSGRTNTINGNVNLLLNHVEHLNQKIDRLSKRFGWGVAFVVALQLVLIFVDALEHLPPLK